MSFIPIEYKDDVFDFPNSRSVTSRHGIGIYCVSKNVKHILKEI